MAVDVRDFYYKFVSDWYVGNQVAGPLDDPALYEEVRQTLNREQQGKATEADFEHLRDRILGRPQRWVTLSDAARMLGFSIKATTGKRPDAQKISRMIRNKQLVDNGKGGHDRRVSIS